VAGLAAASLALACAPSFYDRYAAAHPEFDPAVFPRPAADLAETIAALHAPKRDATDRTSLMQLQVFALEQPWTSIGLDAIADEDHRPGPGRHFLVVARVGCAMTDVYAHYGNEAATWYLVFDDRLAAYRRATLDPRCGARRTRERYKRVPVDYTQCLDGFARDGVATLKDGSVAPDCGPVPLLRSRP
jgi:hypothetical protein